MGVLVQENNVVGSKRRVEARAEHGAHVVRPSRVIRHFRTSVFGHSYVGPDAHAMIVPWPRITAPRPKEDTCRSCPACTSLFRAYIGVGQVNTGPRRARRATRISGYRMRVFRRGVYIPDYTAYFPRTTWLRPSTCASRGTGFRNAALTLGIAMITGRDGAHVLLAALLYPRLYHSVYPRWDDSDFAWLSGESASPIGLRGTDDVCYVKWRRDRRTRSRALSSAISRHRRYRLRGRFSTRGGGRGYWLLAE